MFLNNTHEEVLSPLAPVLWGEGLGVRGLRASLSHVVSSDVSYGNSNKSRLPTGTRFPLTPSPSPRDTGARGEEMWEGPGQNLQTELLTSS